eukprot:GGOE01018069.1.p1 GENE.GGOE01018069.1~~GGOE01018069.1.p1  ORF type:complete len:621 (+),score=237.04 GGOE01018069.1:53-1864(+)
MGKFSNTRKLQKHRYHPSSRSGEASQKKPEPPVVGRLKSPNADQRRDGCLDVAGMATEHDQLRLLVEYNVHLHVCQLLTDPEDKVAAVAAGALKNMLITADTFAEDVFAPLLGPANVMVLIDSVCRALESRWAASATAASSTTLLALTAEMLQFLALLLSKEQAATVFAEDHCRVSFLLASLDRPPPVPFYAAHCLLILSEENVDWQGQSEGFAPLRRFLTAETPVPLRVTCAGVLLNLHNDVADIQALLPSVLQGLTVAPREGTLGVLEHMKVEGFELEKFEDAKRDWLIATKTLTTCCEILANLVPATEDTIDEEVEYDEAELARLEEANFVESSIGQQLLHESVSLVAKVCDKTEELLDVGRRGRSEEALQNDGDMEAAFTAAQSALLALLVDLLLVVPYELCAPRVLALWRVLYADLTDRYTKKGQQQSDGMALACVHALWVLLGKDHRQDEPQRLLTGSEVQPLCVACTQLLATMPAADRPPRLIDLAGRAGQYVTNPAVCGTLGQLLLHQLSDATTGVASAAAALNALFDLFGDERLDGIAKELRLVPALEAFCGPFKRLSGQLQVVDEDDEELLARLAMLHDNLPAFIAYKKGHGC